MKKLGQKLSFLTKVLLVIGLLISNLSSLSVVFAYEAPADVVVNLNEETLEIIYTEKLAQEVKEVDVKVYENYTYSGGLSEKEVMKVYSLTAEQLLAALDGTLELEYDSIFASREVIETTEEETVKNFELFDGTYSARVEIVDVTDYSEEPVEETETTVLEEEITEVQPTETENTITEEVTTGIVLAYGTYEEKMTHESGLNIKLFDSTGAEIVLVDGKYPVSAEYSNVTVVAQILSGGLNPTDVFEYNGEEFMASELIGLEFKSEFDFNGRLFGEYELPVEVKVLKQLPVTETVSEVVETETAEVDENAVAHEETATGENYEEVVYTDSISVLYESYEMNAALLNMVAVSEGYGESYMFYSDAKDGMLYVLSDFEETTEATEETVVTRTMLDLYNMLNVALDVSEGEEQVVSYTLLKNGINVLESYDETTGVELEDYLKTIALDETVSVTLSNEGLTVTYVVVMAGDLNNDNLVTQEDVLELINQVVSENVTDVEKSDLYGFDGEVNSLDVLHLNQVVKTQVWDAEITETEVTLDAVLDVKLNDEALSEENYLTSGDEFTVDYVLSLTDYEVNGIAGVFNYDETLFELVSIEVANEWLGNSNDGKFLYLGEESLTGPELETSEPETELPETSDIENTETTESESSETVAQEESTEETITSVDYVVLTATFRALSATNEESNNVITLEEIELFNSTDEDVTNYVLDQNTLSTEAVEVTASEDNSLQYLEIAGVEITLEDGVYEYEITVASDITAVDLKYILGNVAANVTSTVYPEELAEGNNTVVVTVTSETGVSQDYTITVVREEVEEETTTQVNYNNSYEEDESTQGGETVTPGTTDVEEDDDKDESDLSRIVIIILILLVIAGLVYLIFKDEDDEETKKANKEVNKLKKESLEPEVKTVNKTSNNKTNSKTNNKSNNSKNKNSKNKKKER